MYQKEIECFKETIPNLAKKLFNIFVLSKNKLKYATPGVEQC